MWRTGCPRASQSDQLVPRSWDEDLERASRAAERVTAGTADPYMIPMQDQRAVPVTGTEASTGQPQVLPEAFASWYEEHRSPVYRYVRFRVATREAAEDVTSEVFMKALRALGRYDPARSSPRTWLLRIARNSVTDHLRTLKRRSSLHVSLDRIPDLVADVPSQEERVLRQERIQRLLNGASELRQPDQEILSLRYGAGLDNVEIGKHFEISSNAVAVRLHRALTRLKAVVAAQANDDRWDK